MEHPDGGAAAWRVVGLPRARLGWVLGLGPRRERRLAALADGDGFPALDDGAGAARLAEGLEPLPDHRDVPARALRQLRSAQRHHQLGTLLCLLSHRALAPRLPGGGYRRLYRSVHLSPAPAAPRARIHHGLFA